MIWGVKTTPILGSTPILGKHPLQYGNIRIPMNQPEFNGMSTRFWSINNWMGPNPNGPLRKLRSSHKIPTFFRGPWNVGPTVGDFLDLKLLKSSPENFAVKGFCRRFDRQQKVLMARPGKPWEWMGRKTRTNQRCFFVNEMGCWTKNRGGFYPPNHPF